MPVRTKISKFTTTNSYQFSKQRFSLQKLMQKKRRIRSETLQNPIKLDETMAKKQNNLPSHRGVETSGEIL
jgi:hypothetical protein